MALADVRCPRCGESYRVLVFSTWLSWVMATAGVTLLAVGWFLSWRYAAMSVTSSVGWFLLMTLAYSLPVLGGLGMLYRFREVIGGQFPMMTFIPAGFNNDVGHRITSPEDGL